MKYVLDNSNLAESYSGVTTPLTHSFVSRVYRDVYKTFCKKMGVSDRIVRSHEEEFSGLLAFVGYRMYYNLRNWYTLISFLPAYRTNRRFFDRMIGLEATGDAETSSTGLIRRYGVDLPRVAFQVLRIGASFLFMGFLVRRFNREFDAVFERLECIDLEQLDLEELADLYRKVSGMLLARWWVPIANDFAVMVSTGLAAKALEGWSARKNENSAPLDLRTGASLVSLDPGRRLVQIVQAIGEDEAVHDLFRQQIHPAELHEILSSRHGQSKPYRLIQEYMRKYGSRVPDELKLESETLSERPEFLSGLLMSLVRNEPRTSAAAGTHPPPRADLHGLNPLKRAVLDRLLSWAGVSLGRREETRLRRALIFGYARKLFLTVGQRLQALGILDGPRDVFFLTEEEVFSILATPSQYRDLRPIVAGRKAEMDRWKPLDLPRRIETDGPLDELPEELSAVSPGRSKPHPSGTLRGKGASYGAQDLVSGTALVLPEFRPDAVFKDKILVTRQTDPGWTIVFPFVKALVVERGGILSHAAIVARELGIPCIVGVENATGLIADGATVDVLPKLGEVRINSNAPSA